MSTRRVAMVSESMPGSEHTHEGYQGATSGLRNPTGKKEKVMEEKEAEQLVEYLGHLSASQELILREVEKLSRAQASVKEEVTHLEEKIMAFDLQAFQALSTQLQQRNASLKTYLAQQEEEARRHAALMQSVEPMLSEYLEEVEQERQARTNEREMRASSLKYMNQVIYIPSIMAGVAMCMMLIYFGIQNQEHRQALGKAYEEMIETRYRLKKKEMEVEVRLEEERNRTRWLEALTEDETIHVDRIKDCIEAREAQTKGKGKRQTCLRPPVKR